MRRKIFSLLLAGCLLLAQAIPASAYQTARPGQAVTVSAGDGFAAAIYDDGTLWTWGHNNRGQLGDGATADSNTPVKVLEDVAAVSCGGGIAAAVKTDGTLWTWGGNEVTLGTVAAAPSVPEQLLDGVTAVSCGDGFGAAVKTDGTLWTWESGSEGRTLLSGVAAVSCGDSFGAAVKTDGTLWMWGENDKGQLGDGTTAAASAPKQIMEDVAAVSCGCQQTAAIKTDGTLWTWGDGSSTPVKWMENVMAVSCGDGFGAAVTYYGDLYTWGEGENGKLGNGASEGTAETPERVLSGVVYVTCGSDFGAALDGDGNLYAWGNNTYGQLGNGSINWELRPVRTLSGVKVPALPEAPVRDGEDWIDRLGLPEYANDLYETLAGGVETAGTELLIADRSFILTSTAPARYPDVKAETASFTEPTFFGETLTGPAAYTATFAPDGVKSGDRAIDYPSLTPGDLVRTSSFNGVYVTKIPKTGNANYDTEFSAVGSAVMQSYRAFNYDHPEVFWLDNTVKARALTPTVDGVQTTYVFLLLCDSDGYTLRDSAYGSASKIETDIAARDRAISDILKTASGDRQQKVTALNAYLTRHNQYNTSKDLTAIGLAPHRCLSALTGRDGTTGPVCDGYARAFKVLCDRLEIPCMLVQGYAKYDLSHSGELHMWNAVKMSDGKWYGVDVTWNDPTVPGSSGPVSGRENASYLLVGADTVVYGLAFSVSHPSEDALINSTAFSGLPVLDEGSYNNLQCSKWAAEELSAAERDGLVPDALRSKDFRQPITRAEFAAVAVRAYEALSGQTAPAGTGPFKDTADPEVFRAYTLGIVNGTASDKFSPDDLLSREECATMLTRVYKKINLTGWSLGEDSRFTLSYERPAAFADDGDISTWARDSVYFMAANGIINGVGGNRFAPRNRTEQQKADHYANATREQAVIIALRMVQNLKEE